MMLLGSICNQIEHLGRGLVVQFHRDGDPLAYEQLEDALAMTFPHIRSIVTHGERLAERAEEIIGLCESVTVSVFRGDPAHDRQLASLTEFLRLKGDRLPRVSVKIVGDYDEADLRVYRELGVPILRRLLHTPGGNARYAHRLPIMPEHGLCLDLLHHPSIAWDGRVYLCNRLDTHDAGLIGHLQDASFESIWNGPRRADYLNKHLHGRRNEVPPCTTCQYYGVPSA